jgi:hypothetical protein
MERPDRRASEPQDRHGDDLARHQLRPRERGRLFGAVHGVGHRDRSGQTHGNHLSHGFSRAVRHRLVDVGRRGRHPGLRLHHLPIRVAQPVWVQHENHSASNQPISKLINRFNFYEILIKIVEIIYFFLDFQRVIPRF